MYVCLSFASIRTNYTKAKLKYPASERNYTDFILFHWRSQYKAAQAFYIVCLSSNRCVQNSWRGNCKQKRIQLYYCWCQIPLMFCAYCMQNYSRYDWKWLELEGECKRNAIFLVTPAKSTFPNIPAKHRYNESSKPLVVHENRANWVSHTYIHQKNLREKQFRLNY